MNYKALPIFAAITLLAACTSNERSKEPEMNRLTHFVNVYDSALLKRDTGTLGRMLAEDFISTNTEGRVLNKSQTLGSIATTEMQLNEGKSSDVKVTVFDNAAVVTGTFRGSGTYRGNPVDINERYSTFWIKKDTSWQIVAEHLSVIK